MERQVNALDVAKVLLSLLVVLGHVTRMYTPMGAMYKYLSDSPICLYITDFLYQFHMPAFVAVSGAIFWIQKNHLHKYANWKDFVINKIRRLFVPYFFFGFCVVLPTLLCCEIIDFSQLKGSLFALIVGYDSRHLWFLPMLFGCFMLFNLFNDAIIKHPKVAALVLFVVYVLPIPANIPFYVPTIMHYGIFFCAGYIIGYEIITPPHCERRDMRNPQARARGLSKLKCLASNKILICLSLLLIILFPLFKLQLTLIPSLLGIYVIYGFSLILTRTSIIQNKIFEIILRDNFGLYLWHPMIVYLLFYLVRNSEINTAIMVVAVFITATIISVFLSRFLRKIKCGFVLGE